MTIKLIKAEEARVGFTVTTTAAVFQKLVKLSGPTMEEWSDYIEKLIKK